MGTRTSPRVIRVGTNAARCPTRHNSSTTELSTTTLSLLSKRTSASLFVFHPLLVSVVVFSALASRRTKITQIFLWSTRSTVVLLILSSPFFRLGAEFYQAVPSPLSTHGPARRRRAYVGKIPRLSGVGSCLLALPQPAAI